MTISLADRSQTIKIIYVLYRFRLMSTDAWLDVWKHLDALAAPVAK